MNRVPAWAKGFSCPHEKLDLALVHQIGTTYASAYCSQFLDKFRDVLSENTSGLLPLLENWRQRENEFEDIWDVSFGYTRRVVLENDPSRALQHAALLGLRLHGLGVPGAWEARLDEPVRLRWNQWVLPQARSLAVAARNGDITLELTDGEPRAQKIAFHRNGRQWTTEDAEALPTARAYGCSLTLLPRPALDGLHFGGEITLSRLTPEQIWAKVRKSLKLLKYHAPLYLPWTQRVLRGIIPLHAQLSEIRSGSDFDKPGVIQVSFPIRTVALAETWVHECAHQHFQLLTRVGPVEDGTDKTLYYSPVRQMGRPLDKILLAYHAFANVLLFYRMCRESGLKDNGYLDINELRLIPQLRQLEEPLRKTTGLTELGRALWEPLAKRIRIWQN